MDFIKEQRQRKEFRDILFELAVKQEMLQDAYTRSAMYKRLEALYYAPKKEEGFRHFYSDIFTVLTQIQQDSGRGDINILGQNLSMIRAGYNPQNQDSEGNVIDIGDNIRKLYDHVSLDIARISYSDAGDRKTSGEESVSEIQSQIKQMNLEVEKAVTAQRAVEQELGKQQREYIAILGIFAAVVLAFTGGIAFSTSVYVDRLANGKENEKLKPLRISNLVILILLAGAVFAWYSGLVEMRDARINRLAPVSDSRQNETKEDTEGL